MQRIANGIGKNGLAIFCAKDQVDVQASKGLWHMARPFRAPIRFAVWSQGVALGLIEPPFQGWELNRLL